MKVIERLNLLASPLIFLAVVLLTIVIIAPVNTYFTAWTCIVVAFVLSKRSIGDKVICGALVTLILLRYWSISRSEGEPYFYLTIAFFVFTLPLFLLYFVTVSTKILNWIIPFFLAGAAFIWYQVIVLCGAPEGLAGNRNPSGGILVLGIVYLFSLKNRLATLLTIPLISAVLITGSRQSFLMLVVVSTLLAIALLWQKTPLKSIVLGSLVVIVGSGLLTLLGHNLTQMKCTEEINPVSSTAVERATGILRFDLGQPLKETITRATAPEPFPLLPKGEFYVPNRMHDIPLHTFATLGVFGGLAWIFVMLYALIRKPYFTPLFWVFVTVLALSAFDYYWLQPAAGIYWWLILGLRSREIFAGSQRKSIVREEKLETI